MTVNPNNSYELDISKIVRLAFHTAGLKDAWESAEAATNGPDGEIAREYLGVIISSLALEGPLTRRIGFYDLQLATGTYRYTLPTGVMDVVGDAQFIGAAEADITKASSELHVSKRSREEWHALTAKNSVGKPSIMYVHRESPSVQVWFWPIPDEAGTVRIPVDNYLADSDEGQYRPDLDRYCDDYLITALAAKLAMAAGSLKKATLLDTKANAVLLPKVRGKMNQNTETYLYPDYGARNA